MQRELGAALRQVWGDKPCEHPALDTESYRGALTGQYLCTTCGRTFTPEEAVERRRGGSPVTPAPQTRNNQQESQGWC